MTPPPRSPPKHPGPGGRRLVIYARVSTDRQAEHGQGLPVQISACRAWCRSNGHTVAGVLADEGVSGTADALPDRSGLLAALDLLRTGKAAGIVVYRLDRLARDMVLQEQLLADIVRLGGALHSTSAVEDAHLVDDPDDPTRALVRQVLGAVAQHERAMIRLRMAAGKKRKRDAGGYTGGQPPYGFKAIAGALVPDPELAGVVDTIRRRRREGWSLREIAAELELITGESWHPQKVARVLAVWERTAE